MAYYQALRVHMQEQSPRDTVLEFVQQWQQGQHMADDRGLSAYAGLDDRREDRAEYGEVETLAALRGQREGQRQGEGQDQTHGPGPEQEMEY
jgi:hypothetical protein